MSRQRTAYILLLLLTLPLSNQAQTKGNSENDGATWLDWPSALRIAFISGFLEGSILMREQTLREITAFTQLEEFKGLSSGAQLGINMDLGQADALSIYNIKVGQIVSGLDTFYADFSVRKIQVIDAIYIVKMQIEGKMRIPMISATCSEGSRPGVGAKRRRA